MQQRWWSAFFSIVGISKVVVANFRSAGNAGSLRSRCTTLFTPRQNELALGPCRVESSIVMSLFMISEELWLGSLSSLLLVLLSIYFIESSAREEGKSS